MPDVKALLNRIWSQCRNAGISNDDQIVEHLAALLTEDYEQPEKADLQLRKLAERGDLHLDQIEEWLDQAMESVDESFDIKGKKAALFDRFILFQYQQIRNGYYPTPRHIAQYMRRLVQLKREHTLVDFACGSGGLLVERVDSEQQPREIIGVDISPDWARLAWVNTRLHGSTEAHILVKDALRAVKEDLPGRTFERILMNPPFGGTVVNAQLVKEVVGETTTDSTVILTALALQTLAPGGYAAILVPNGILFSGTGGAPDIRDLLIGRDKDGNFQGSFNLKAIISLPPDALKPFSGIRTHILLIQKRKTDQVVSQNNTWFFRPAKDGYEEGNRRGVLTSQPGGPNELTLVEHTLQKYNTTQDSDLQIPEADPLFWLKVIIQENLPLAILIEVVNNVEIAHVLRCPERGDVSAFFLIEFVRQGKEQGTYYLRLTIDKDGSIETQPADQGYYAQDRQQYLRSLYKVDTDKDLPLTSTLLDQKYYARAIVIAHGNGLLGVAIATKGILPGNLQPDQYVKTLNETGTREAPALLLGRVRVKQAAFLQQIDGVLGRLDLPPIAKTALPSPLAKEKDLNDQEQYISPFRDMSVEQGKIWQRICRVSDEHKEQNGLFTLRDIISMSDGIEEEQVRLTIELFEWMGVIIPVTLMNPETHESLKTPLYQRLTERYVWSEDDLEV